MALAKEDVLFLSKEVCYERPLRVSLVPLGPRMFTEKSSYSEPVKKCMRIKKIGAGQCKMTHHRFIPGMSRMVFVSER